jgi:hypothetical protein
MTDFYEFLSHRKKLSLPDALTLMAMIGIDPLGPHEIDVQRAVKRKKKAAEKAPGNCSAVSEITGTMRKVPRFNQSAT